MQDAFFGPARIGWPVCRPLSAIHDLRGPLTAILAFAALGLLPSALGFLPVGKAASLGHPWLRGTWAPAGGWLKNAGAFFLEGIVNAVGVEQAV
jgi:hypothetical protein